MTPIEAPPPPGKMKIRFLSNSSFMVIRSDGNFRTIKTAIDFSLYWFGNPGKYHLDYNLPKMIENTIRANMRVVKWLQEGKK